MDQAEKRAARHKEDLRWVMSTMSGRRVMHNLIVHGGMFRSSFAGENEKTTEFAEGMRQMALMIWRDLDEHCPEMLTRTLEENRNVYRHEDETDS